MALKVFQKKLVIAGIGSLILLIIIWAGSKNFSYGLIVGILAFFILMWVTSKKHMERAKEKGEERRQDIENFKRMKERMHEIERTANAMERGRLRGQEDYAKLKKLREEQNKIARKLANDPFGFYPK